MATIAAALIGAGTTYWAGRQANKRSPQERQMETLMGQNAQLSGQYGKDMLGRSREALDPVFDHYRTLASGDRNALMQYFAPDIDRQTTATQQAFQTGMELAPRSGIATERNSAMPMNNAAAIARLLSSGRAEGLQGLNTLGTNWASLGMSGLSQGAGGAAQVLGYGADRRRDAMSQGQSAGDSAYAIFKLIQDAAANRNAGAGAGGSMTPQTANSMMSFWGKGQ